MPPGNFGISDVQRWILEPSEAIIMSYEQAICLVWYNVAVRHRARARDQAALIYQSTKLETHLTDLQTRARPLRLLGQNDRRLLWLLGRFVLALGPGQLLSYWKSLVRARASHVE